VCNGDSGSALVIPKNRSGTTPPPGDEAFLGAYDEWEQIGLASYGEGCGDGYMVYADAVVAMRDFIAQTLEAPYDVFDVPVQLVDGDTPYDGRVEVFYDGEWGTVCDDTWSLADATVVCRQLFGTAAIGAPCCAYYGEEGSSSILMDEVLCDGNETNLGHCNFDGWGRHNCDHSEDAGVRCFPADPQDGEIVLVGGATPYEGRVEIFHQGEWGTVCDRWWSFDDSEDASVVCRQLFGRSALDVYSTLAFGEGSGPIWMDAVNCDGNETSLAQCDFAGWGVDGSPASSRQCTHSDDATVRCAGAVVEDLRLVGGSSDFEGRVEVYHAGEWGTVCHDGFSLDEATVICQELFGLPAISAECCATFGEGDYWAPIWMDYLRCRGTETNLSDCLFSGFGVHGCDHWQDAGVRCGSLSSSSSTSKKKKKKKLNEGLLAVVIVVVAIVVIAVIAVALVLCQRRQDASSGIETT